MEVIRIYL